jgi:hypothetical protein
MASHDATLASMYSASAELNATDFFFLLNQETTPDPKLKKHLEVLFLSTVLLAQFASVKPINFTQSPWI